MIDREYSERRTFQLHWACQQSRPMLEDIEIGRNNHSGRWSAALLETPQQDRTIPETAPTSDAFGGPPAPNQPIPVQRREAILEALYRISEGFWFSPSELVMIALLHFKDKVHRKGLARAESLPLLMPRLLSQVLEHLGFPEEPRI